VLAGAEMITIKQFPPELEIEAKGSDIGIIWLLEPSQRQLLAWFAREKPQMVREAMGVDKVIATLEKEEQDAIFRYTNATTMNEETYQQGIVFAYQRAIALLKGEVGK
jgi:hypothetical protein